MIALSIRQPWPWLILRPDVTDAAERAALYAKEAIKDIENRTWPTKVRGRIAIHAGVGVDRWTPEDYNYLRDAYGVTLPCGIDKLERGGIVGVAELTDCVSDSESQWFSGPYGFVLRNAQPVPFAPIKGRLGFFEVPDELIHVPV